MFDGPEGTVNDGLRLEGDSMGKVWVPADRLWGAGTQRALKHFRIGTDVNPPELIRALVIVKEASAMANRELLKLDEERASAIIEAAREAVSGKLDGHFPLPVWLSGSGTQLNMNVNEVLANRAIELMGGIKGTRSPVHPNDHVNMSQSTNDVFPTAMNIAALTAIRDHLGPAVRKLADGLEEKAKAWAGITKIGRTHLMDAVPLTLGQEFSGYAAMIGDDLARLDAVLPGLYHLAIGGTAVGTGITAEKGFGDAAVRHIAGITGLPVSPAPNRFAVQGAHDAMVMVSAALKGMAVSLFKIANDIRLLASGPDAGIRELILPANEPGSSIMPGKVNPTQCEAMTMVAVQVMGYDLAVAFAGAGGYLEMNAYKPLIAFNVIQSIRLISDACNSFETFLVAGLKPDRKKIDDYVNRSLMLVTALVPVIGYDRAARVVDLAVAEGLTLKDAALKLGCISAEEFDRVVDPYRLAHDNA